MAEQKTHENDGVHETIPTKDSPRGIKVSIYFVGIREMKPHVSTDTYACSGFGQLEVFQWISDTSEDASLIFSYFVHLSL